MIVLGVDWHSWDFGLYSAVAHQSESVDPSVSKAFWVASDSLDPAQTELWY